MIHLDPSTATDLSRLCTLFPHGDGSQRIVAFIKSTFSVPPSGPMRPLATRLPLNTEVLTEGGDDRFPVRTPVTEYDLWPSKPWTDVVVHGRITAPDGRPLRELKAAVAVGESIKTVQVIGDRQACWTKGRISFTEPEPFSTMELSWRRAYGGIDRSVPLPAMEDMVDFWTRFTPEEHPGAYPRNPAGTGWVVNADPEIIDGLRLPNFEDPSHRLAAHRLVRGDASHWISAPVPAGFGWFGQGWFPRSLLLGMGPPVLLDVAEDDIVEAQTGWLPPGVLERVIAGDRAIDPHFQSGASPGMRFRELEYGTPVQLLGFSADGLIRTNLPNRPPEVLIALDRRSLETRIRLSTVEFLPDEGIAHLVWVATAISPHVFPRRLPRMNEPDYDMLDGVDVVVDGELLAKGALQ